MTGTPSNDLVTVRITFPSVALCEEAIAWATERSMEFGSRAVAVLNGPCSFTGRFVKDGEATLFKLFWEGVNPLFPISKPHIIIPDELQHVEALSNKAVSSSTR